MTQPRSAEQRGAATATPVLLFNDECGVCRRIASWVTTAARTTGSRSVVDVRPIGDDPGALRSLNSDLDIWDAYETIHLLMPDGSMKTGGEAVAEVFRRLPRSKWFAWSFRVKILGLRPFQLILNVAYAALADIRPVFGCESCGTPSGWQRPFAWLARRFTAARGNPHHQPIPHLTRAKTAA